MMSEQRQYDDILSIVWQHMMLPMETRSDERMISLTLQQRLIKLRESILNHQWTFSCSDHLTQQHQQQQQGSVVQHRRENTVFQQLERQYLNDIGFFDITFIKKLMKTLKETTYPNIVNTKLSTRTARTASMHEDQLRVICEELMTNYYYPVLRMVQYKLLSVINHIRSSIYPDIESLVLLWFQRQQERYSQHLQPNNQLNETRHGLIVHQIIAIYQWQNRMETIDLFIQNVLEIALMMDERTETLPQYHKEFSLYSSMEGFHRDRNGKFPVSFCKSMAHVYYERCESLMQFVLGHKHPLDNMCTRVLASVVKIRDTLTHLNKLSIPCSVITTTGATSGETGITKDLANEMKPFIESLTTCAFGANVIDAYFAIQDSVLGVIGNIFTDENLSKLLAPIDESLLTDRSYSLSKHHNEQLGRSFYTIDVIKTSLREMLSYGFTLALTNSRGNSTNIEALRRDASGLLQKLCFFNRCHVIALQTPNVFEPWSLLKPKAIKTFYLESGDLDRFLVFDVLQTGLNIVYQSMFLLQSEFRLVKGMFSNSNIVSNANAKLVVYISMYRRQFGNTLSIALLVVMLYLSEAMHSKGVIDFDMLQYRYHQHCYEFTQRVVKTCQSILDVMICMTTEYSQQDQSTLKSCNVFHELMNMASYGFHCANINCHTLFSIASIIKLLSGNTATSPTAPIVVAPDPVLNHECAVLLLMILVASIRATIMKQIVSQVYSLALRAINCDRRAHNTNDKFCIDGFSRNQFSPVLFNNLNELMDVVDVIKTIDDWIMNSSLALLDDGREALFAECVSFQTILLDLSIHCSNKLVKIGLEKRDSKRRASQGNFDPPAVFSGITMSYGDMLNAEEGMFKAIREESWKMFYHWRVLFHDTTTMHTPCSDDSHKKVMLTNLRKRLLRMKLVVMAITATNAQLQTKLGQTIDEEDGGDEELDEHIKRERFIKQQKKQQTGIAMLQSVHREIQRVLQMVGVNALCEDSATLFARMRATNQKPFDTGKATVGTNNMALNIMDIEAMLNEVIAVYGLDGCVAASTGTISKGIDALADYLYVMEKCLDICLTLLQVITHTFVQSEDDTDYNIDGAGNPHRFNTGLDEVKTRFVQKIVIPGLQKPLEKAITSTEFHSAHKHIMQSPFVYSLAKQAGVNKKVSATDCRSWLGGKAQQVKNEILLSLGRELDVVIKQVGQKWLTTNQQATVEEETHRLCGNIDGKSCDDNTIILFRLLGITD